MGADEAMLFNFVNRYLGQYRRHKGFYDKVTLRCFAAASAANGSPVDLLYYALFRRDLGKPLPARWVSVLMAALYDFTPYQRRMALGLLAEARPDSLSNIDLSVIADGIQLPAVASRVPNLADDLSSIARIDVTQLRWRQDFADQLNRALSSGGVAVVGNAATLSGLRLGTEIDQHDLVVRFNHFMGNSGQIEDVGRRTDVWVVSPGYRGPLPEEVSWVVMTGPDMRYRLSDWHRVIPLIERGVPLLTIPLSIWGGLVRILNAPPSAGVFVLAWLNSLTDCGWRGVSAAGVGTGLGKGGRYHASLSRHTASGRHAWSREVRLVEAWRQNGLSIVTTKARGEP